MAFSTKCQLYCVGQGNPEGHTVEVKYRQNIVLGVWLLAIDWRLLYEVDFNPISLHSRDLQITIRTMHNVLQQ
jgi:hypothetical protein